MIFQTELTSLESELSQLEMMLIAKRQQMGFFQNLQNQADECLEKLSRVVNHAKENTASGAIASLKTAVLGLFDGGNQPNDPTPDTDPTPGADHDEPDLIAFNGETGDYLKRDGSTSVDEETPPLTYAQTIKNRCSACWGYEVTTKADIKSGFVNRTTLNFMEAVNLERSGKDFYQTVEAYLDRLYYNGQSCKLEDCPELSLVGQHYQLTSPLASLLWEDAPLTGQHCAITLSTLEDNENKSTTDGETMRFVELIKVTDALAYQRKHDGEIICCYFGFKTKAHAQSWMHFFEAVTSKVELRQAKRLQGCKWEIKVSGLSINQIERYAKDCDFSKSYRTEVCSSKPPSYTEPHRPQPVNPDEVEPGDIVTPLLTPGDSYEVLQVMPNGILDCKSLRTGVNMGMRPSAVTLVQKATKYPPCPFNEGDLVDWKGCILRVAAIGVETLHCVLRSDPDGTKPHTRVAIAECSMVDDF
jgi:hypothetical protein